VTPRGFLDEHERQYRRDEAPVEIPEVQSLRATNRAVLCVIRGNEVWVPQSQITDDSEVYAANQTGTLVVRGWWARQKGLG
jgi:hypothetical protein